MKRTIKKGVGWRIGWDPQEEMYQGLVGAEDWAFELTEPEFRDFCRLLGQLGETMDGMKEELMNQERIACEAESDLLWMEVEGYPHAYSLRVILRQSRCCEGNWEPESVSGLVQAAQSWHYQRQNDQDYLSSVTGGEVK
jgi:hypothetical protein